MGLLGLYASSCVLRLYVAGQRRSIPGLVLGLIVMSSHAACGERRSLLFRSDLSSSSLLGVMQRHTHRPVLIDRMKTDK